MSPDNERGLFVESDIEYPAEIKRTTGSFLLSNSNRNKF